MTIRLVIADDHKIVRQGLRSLLEREPGINVVAEANNGREAIKFASELKPDVVVMDLSMPEMNGIEATRRIVEASGDTRVLALSMHYDKRFVVEALAAGAKGYLLKDCASEELVGAIHTVAVGETYLSPKIAGLIVGDYLNKGAPSPDSAARLTPREREVLQLFAEGKSTKEVAFLLSVSNKTIETHRVQIMRKLNIRSVAELTKYAIREGITSL
ncbi:response regulator [Geobacter grbiciae]|uniref:response regulator n=1 Tax=Geobacter grbiciae TaxID=155042 RepID=UPI001C00C10E|nr:response regulator transcription factor [Geobacter grbiciae]MBT1076696.1 response regulator transcription factor [Geobacter grbiciae]